MKQMEFTILGQSYILGCPEGGEQALQQAVSAVDREMSAIRDAGKVKARERIAVLAALNLAYSLADRAESTGASVASAPSTDGAPAAVPAPAPAADLSPLIRRLDDILREDGQLL